MEVAAIPLATDPTVEPSERPASLGGSFDLVLSTLVADLVAAPPSFRHLGSPEGESVEVARGEALPDADPAPGSSVMEGTAPDPLPAESPLGDLPLNHLNLSQDDLVVASPAPLAVTPGDETTSAIRGGAVVRVKGDGVPAPAPQRVLGAAVLTASPAIACPTEVKSVGVSEGRELEGVEAARGPRGRGRAERLWTQWVRARVGRAHGGVPVSEGEGPKDTMLDADGGPAPNAGEGGRVSDLDLVASSTMIVGAPVQGGEVEAPPSGEVSDTPEPQESGVRVWHGSTTGDAVFTGDYPVSDGSSPDGTGAPLGSGATAAEPVLPESDLPPSSAPFGDAERVSRAGLVPPVPESEGVSAQRTSPRFDETTDRAEVTVGKEVPTLDSVVDPSPDGRGEEPTRAVGGAPVAAPDPRPGRENGRRVRPTHPAVSRVYPTHEPSARVQATETVVGSTASQGAGPSVSMDPSDWGDQGTPELQRIGVSKVEAHPVTHVALPPEGPTAPVPVRAVSATPIHGIEAPASPTVLEVSSPVAAGGGAEPASAPSPPSFQHPGWAASNAHRLAHSIRVAWDRGRGELRMRLDPPHLGRVQVILRQGADGMSAHLRVENIEAQHLLAESVATLREALGARGVPLADVSVTVDSGSGRQADSEAEVERRRRRGRRMGLEELAETGSADPLSTSPDGWTPWGFETRI